MLDLAQIPFYSVLSRDALGEVRETIESRTFAPGASVCRRGQAGEAFFAIASGGVMVGVSSAPTPKRREFFLGPGEVFGEMSLISGLPVSANVTAAKATVAYAMPREAFLSMLEAHPELRASLAEMLVHRMRHRTDPAAQNEAPAYVLLELDEDLPRLRSLARAISRGVSHYAPGSRSLEDPGSVRQPEDWRNEATGGQYFLHPAFGTASAPVAEQLRSGDVLLRLEAPNHDSPGIDPAAYEGPAEHAIVGLSPDGRNVDGTDTMWRYRVDPREIDTALDDSRWQREDYPNLDRVVRWITRRETGLALGAGLARGLAHLGVIEVLEQAGIPIDFLCGSSMGGILALCYAKEGSASAAIESTRRSITGNETLREFSWFPRSALLAGHRVRRTAVAFSGGATFADLFRPVAVVAADLAGGQRVILNRGPIWRAMMATSAIPGLLPPVLGGGRLMVDGALVSRLPVYLLEQRRCALKIAVNVIPSPAAGTEGSDAEDLAGRIERFFGLREVIAKSWDLLGWWHGSEDAAQADILIEPVTSRYSGSDLAAIDPMIEAGRTATLEKLPMIKAAYRTMMRPGTP